MCYFSKGSAGAGLQHTGVSIVQMSEDTGCPNQPARNVNSAKISQGNFNDSSHYLSAGAFDKETQP